MFRQARPRQRRGGLASLLLVAVLAVGAVWFMKPGGRSLSGQATVVDGDTLRLGEVTIRLEGLDAPEMRQSCERDGRSYRCGVVARDALGDKLREGPLTCRVVGRDRYRRSLARCSIDGDDIGAWLVGAGLAVAYGGYEPEEAMARRRRLGLWAGTFQSPRAWRQEHTRS
jgi:endonuclease YncB( thermonuclease family)